jgi:hypothetical protein
LEASLALTHTAKLCEGGQEREKKEKRQQEVRR